MAWCASSFSSVLLQLMMLRATATQHHSVKALEPHDLAIDKLVELPAHNATNVSDAIASSTWLHLRHRNEALLNTGSSILGYLLHPSWQGSTKGISALSPDYMWELLKLALVFVVCSLVVMVAYRRIYADNLPVQQGKEEVQRNATLNAKSTEEPDGTRNIDRSTRSEAEWLNQILSGVWPRLDAYIQRLVPSMIEPALERALPSALRGTSKVNRFMMGNCQPQCNSIKVRQCGGSTAIDVRVDLDLDVDLSLSAMYMGAGVRHLVLCGTLSIVLRPSSQPPFFGGLEVFFLNTPKLNLDFTGLAKVADFPGVSSVIRSTIMDVVNQSMVLPARIMYDVEDPDAQGIADQQFLEPLGILRITVRSAQNLPVSVSFTGQKRSLEPYVVVEVGQDCWTSPKAAKVTSPTWDQNNVTDVFIYDMAQQVNFLVYGEDWVGKNTLLAEARGVPVETLRASVTTPNDSETQNTQVPLTIQGKLRQTPGLTSVLSAFGTWLEFTDVGAGAAEGAVALGGPSQLLVIAKVISVTGLPLKAAPPFTVRLAIGSDFAVVTQASKPKPDTQVVMEEIRGICGRLAKRGMRVHEISQIVRLDQDQVRDALATENGAERATKQLRERQRQREVTHPEWNEALKLLVPWDSQMTGQMVTLELRDKNGSSVGGCVQMPMVDVVAGALGAGPFSFNTNIVLQASLRTRWLRAS